MLVCLCVAMSAYGYVFLCVRVCPRTCACDCVNVRACISASMFAFACVFAISAT